MTCPRLARLLRRAALVLAVPPVVWVLALAVMPTGWARNRVAAAIERETGRAVTLAELRLGPLGGIRLRGLELSERGREHQPWLQVDRIVIVPDWACLIAGRLEPASVEAQGLTFRAERRTGGDFPFRDLLRSQPHEAGESDPASTGSSLDAPRSEVQFRVSEVQVSLLDEPTGTRLEFAGLTGHGVWRGHRATIEHLAGRLNGGTFELEAELERGTFGPMFEVQTFARQVAVGRGMDLLGFVVPVLPEATQEVQGRMDLNLYLRGQGNTRAELTDSLVGQGSIRLDPIELRESPLVAELTRVLKLPDRIHVGSVHGDFGIAKGRILSNQMTLDAGGTPIVLSGSTDFHGRVDYRVRSEAVQSALGPLLAELPLTLDDVVELRLRGTPGRLSASIDGLPLRNASGQTFSDREQIRELGRRLRERVFR